MTDQEPKTVEVHFTTFAGKEIRFNTYPDATPGEWLARRQAGLEKAAAARARRQKRALTQPEGPN